MMPKSFCENSSARKKLGPVCATLPAILAPLDLKVQPWLAVVLNDLDNETVGQSAPLDTAGRRVYNSLSLGGGRYPGEPDCLALYEVPDDQSVVSITFDVEPIDKTFYFTEEFLTNNFGYFRAALSATLTGCRVRNFVEGEKRHFHFQDHTCRHFGRILVYLERRLRLGDGYEEDHRYRPEEVEGLLEAVILADYLDLKLFAKFEEYISERLAFTLVMNRLRLDGESLLLVVDHPAFRSGLLWDVFAKAGVRVEMKVSYLVERTDDRPLDPAY